MRVFASIFSQFRADVIRVQYTVTRMQKSAITNSLIDSILRQFSLKVRAKQQPSATGDCFADKCGRYHEGSPNAQIRCAYFFQFHGFSYAVQVWTEKLALWANYVSYKRREPPPRGPVTASPFAAAPAAPPAAQYFSAFDNHCGSLCLCFL